MKLLIFGTGRFFENHREQLVGHTIVGFIDNDSHKWKMEICGIAIYEPRQGLLLEYDKILLMSIETGEMKRQLLEQFGIPNDKVVLWDEYQSLMDKGHLELYSANICLGVNKKEKVLIIAQELDYSGGPLTAAYAAKVLYDREYQVCIAAPGGKADLIHEINDMGIDVVLYKNLNYASLEELWWIEPFQFVIVNTLLIRHCALLIHKEKPLFWWIHEVNEVYENLNKIDPYIYNCDVSNIKIFAVSDIARKNFIKYFRCNHLEILPYGIPDRNFMANVDKSNDKVVIAIIGPVIERKGQDIFINAIKQMDAALCLRTEFWMIGDLFSKDPFAGHVLKESAKVSNIIFKGRMTRKEMEQAYKEIDVVVCASREETMSMAVTEGMMYGKVCVTSDATGIAEFIRDGENGFIFKSESYTELGRKLSDILNCRYNLEQIKDNARKTYLENFSMDIFGNRIEQIFGNR